NAAGRGIAILFFGLLIAAVLQAEGLRKQAQIQPAGFQRDIALHLTRPLAAVSRTLHLTTPRHELQVAIVRENEDRIDTQVHLSLPPPGEPPAARPRRQGAPPPPPHRVRHVKKRVAPAAVAKPRFTAARPLRIWVAGDSLAQVPGD